MNTCQKDFSTYFSLQITERDIVRELVLLFEQDVERGQRGSVLTCMFPDGTRRPLKWWGLREPLLGLNATLQEVKRRANYTVGKVFKDLRARGMSTNYFSCLTGMYTHVANKVQW